MHKIFIKIAFVPIVLLCSEPMLADKKYGSVDAFEAIDIGTGMVGKVICDSKNTVTIEGDKSVLANVEVKIRDGKLEISRKFSASTMLRHFFLQDDDDNSAVRVVVTVMEPLTSISSSTGSSLTVPGCAINTRFVTVTVGTGASISVSGNTDTLDLNLSTGSQFNKSSDRFSVDVANVSLSTGAIANLCGAMTINGNASTGANIVAAESANTENVSLFTGARISKVHCQ